MPRSRIARHRRVRQYCPRARPPSHSCVNMGSGRWTGPGVGRVLQWTGSTAWRISVASTATPTRTGCAMGAGHEMYGGWQIGSMAASDYVKKARAVRDGHEAHRSSISYRLRSDGGASGTRSPSASPRSSTSTRSTSTRGGPDHTRRFPVAPGERAIRICSALIERVRYRAADRNPITSRSTNGTSGGERAATRTAWRRRGAL